MHYARRCALSWSAARRRNGYSLSENNDLVPIFALAQEVHSERLYKRATAERLRPGSDND
jgi:hypothetical protein